MRRLVKQAQKKKRRETLIGHQKNETTGRKISMFHPENKVVARSRQGGAGGGVGESKVASTTNGKQLVAGEQWGDISKGTPYT